MFINNDLSEFQKGKILLVDKPWGWSSFKIVKEIKNYITKIGNNNSLKIKIGHAGTLDPLATGLLVVLTGKFTKKVSIIQNCKKSYTGIIKLGCDTFSFDSETKEKNFSSISHINEKMIENISEKFTGEIEQFPPYFSALKKKGKKYYEYARIGKKMNFLTSRIVKIYKFSILKIKIPYIRFFIECGKGTYIRSLANDFGIALKSRAYLLSLRRERIGRYSLNKNHKNSKLIRLNILHSFICYLCN
ncbi:tRNA pseudouridine(55) synthase TruB [Blattabacterium cuenoti]|uniref:tRNA pseudouridine(55) synthase TruB n=1 Tax=Blattabacterium cuenoti TaxID=1653831 RepID=UPI00163B70A4|nr:tRNA pseudouridine(55) synthase TruB [Blattabacterium cuenoti]